MSDVASAKAQAADWLSDFDRALRSRDIAAVQALCGDECFWRDLVSFTWNIKTMEGRDEISDMLAANLEAIAPSNWRLAEDIRLVDGLVEAWLTYETAVARGQGHLRLRDGKAWTLLTAMTELKGHEERKGPTRIEGVEHGVYGKQKNWLEKKREEEEALGFQKQPYCVIIGGGQGGIALGARMKRLGVPTIILEKNERPGDSWRKRYKSLVLHEPVWYDHLPYLPFPDDWPANPHRASLDRPPARTQHIPSEASRARRRYGRAW
jgi:putative flavoprotein involved in K+ transport